MRKYWLILSIFLYLLPACGSKGLNPGATSDGTASSGDGSTDSAGTTTGDDISEPLAGPHLELLSPARQFVSPGENAKLEVQFEAGEAALSTIQISQNGVILDGYPRALTGNELASGKVLFSDLSVLGEGNHGETTSYTVRVTDSSELFFQVQAQLITVLPLYPIEEAQTYLTGLVDIKQGEVQVEPIYSHYIRNSACGTKTCYHACNFNVDSGIFCSLLDPSGQVAIPFLYKTIKDGVTLGQPWFEKEQTFYIVKARAPGYNFNNFFDDGDELDDSGNLYGLVDAQGREILPPIYYHMDWIYYQDNKNPQDQKFYPYLMVTTNDTWETKLFSLKTSSFVEPYLAGYNLSPEGLFAMRSGDKYGFIDLNADAQVKIDFLYDEVGTFTEGLARVKKGGQWGFIDLEGNSVIAAQYDYVSDFSYGVASAKKDGKERLINPQNEQLSALYDYISVGDQPNQEDPLSAFAVGDQQGCINRKGEEVISLQESGAYVWCKWPQQGYIVVQKDDLQGLLKPTINGGEVKLPMQFKAFDLEIPGFILTNDGIKIELLTEDTLTPVIQDIQDSGYEYKDDRLALKVGGLWGFINGKSEWVIPPQYQDFSMKYSRGFSKGWACVSKGNNQSGYIDVDNNPLVIPEEQDKSFIFSYCWGFDKNGIAQVEKYGWKTRGYLRNDGTYLWKPAP